jgi:hypothetical protein
MRSIVIGLVLLFASRQAAACSYVLFPPEQEFADTQVVALVSPIEISFQPRQAAAPDYKGAFTQTIKWGVLLSWKGPHKSGEAFTTRRTFPKAGPCNYFFSVRDRSAYLFYGRGREPYEFFRSFNPAEIPDHFKFLSKRPAQ